MAKGQAQHRPSTPAAGIEGGVDPSIVDARPISPVSDLEQLKRDVASLNKKNADLKTTTDYYNLITITLAFIVAMGAVPVILEENGMPEWSEVFKTLAKQAVADGTKRRRASPCSELLCRRTAVGATCWRNG